MRSVPSNSYAKRFIDLDSFTTGVTVRSVPSNSSCAMTSEALKSAMASDLEKGHYPFFVVATLGTTSTCAFDEVCKRHNANITL